MSITARWQASGRAAANRIIEPMDSSRWRRWAGPQPHKVLKSTTKPPTREVVQIPPPLMGFASTIVSVDSLLRTRRARNPIAYRNHQVSVVGLRGARRRRKASSISIRTIVAGQPWRLPSLSGGGVAAACFNSSASHVEESPARTSPEEVKREIQKCYELVQKLGRGVIYLGSSRVKTDHPHYLQAVELAREIAKLLECTTWTGAGPGLMDAAIKGALAAKKPVGGFKIAKESGEWTSSNFHPYLSTETYLTCRFFSARKHGLVDAAVRNNPLDMTAVVAFPGGIGTLDEVFEILALIQLERIGSKLPIPFLLMNYDSFYSKLLDFMDECEKWGTVAKGEVSSLWKICNGNSEALDYLAEFYNIPQSRRSYKNGFGMEFVESK